MMDHSSLMDVYGADCRRSVFRHIRAYLEKKTADLPFEMKKCVVDYPYRRGKAVRPTMTMLFSDAFGADHESALKVAAAFQLLEDWGLGRDDLLDGGVLRRGRPSLHLLYGVPKAINALDMLHAYVWDMLYSYCALPPRKYRLVHDIFTETTTVTLSGQHLDVEARAIPLEKFTEEAYRNIVKKKTAFYTGAVPGLLGAALAGRKSCLGGIRRFGAMLGESFQIMDDVLDVENDGTGRFGKIPGNDIVEGKRTMVVLEALRVLRPRERRELANFYALAPEEKRPKQVAVMRLRILRSGAPSLCRQKARKISAAALRVFEKDLAQKMKPPYGDLIREFVLRLASREM